jgi:hypothetical protein
VALIGFWGLVFMFLGFRVSGEKVERGVPLVPRGFTKLGFRGAQFT